MFYNTSSHLIFYCLFFNLDNLISRISRCDGLALSPWQTGSITPQKYSAVITCTKSPLKHYPIIITTDTEEIFKTIKDYIQQNIHNIALRISVLSKNNLRVTCSFDDPTEHAQSERTHISIIAYVRCSTSQYMDNYFTIYIPLEFFNLFKIRISDSSLHSSLKDIETQFIQFFHDPYNLFPSLSIILETMEDNEFQKLIYFLLNEKILTPYHLYLLTRAFPQHSLKIKYNISSNLISDILHVGRTVHRVTSRDLIEGVYAFEEILYLKLRTKPYFGFGNFIDQINKVLHNITILHTFQKKSFETWFFEIEQSGLLYTIVSHCDDVTIAQAFHHNTRLYQKLSQHLSSRRMKNITLCLNKKFSYEHTILSQYAIVQLYLERISHIHTLYTMPFHHLLKKYIDPQMMYYILFEIGWFTIATALKHTPKKLVSDCIKNFPEGAKYCIMDVYNGVLNPNIVHDEIQVKKARRLILQSLIRLHCKGTIHFQV